MESDKDKKSAKRRIKRLSERGVVYGTWDNYTYYEFAGDLKLKEMINYYGLKAIQKRIDYNVKARMKKGEQILNTNFEELGLKK